MSLPLHPNRRRFLTTAATTLAIPTILPRSVFGANEKIVTGHIGVRNQGTSNLKAFLKLAAPAAVCDVDADVLAAAVKLLETGGVSRPSAARDYRSLLDRKDIDAVVVTTPDHWHALMTIHACQAGKDVYCEKPLSLTIAEGRQMVDTARKCERVVQTGSQQRSDDRFRQACEFIRSGRLGKIKTVLVGIPKVNSAGAPVPDSDPPAVLDYDVWLGPAPKRPYNEKRVHYNFRFFWDYSGGQMANFGAHHLDIAQWALGRDESGPVRTEGVATFHPEHWYEVTSTCRVTHTYDDGVTVVVGQEQPDIPGGVTFVGSEGTLFVDRSKIVAKPAELLKTPLSASDVHLEVSKNHHQNFLDCIKSRRRPIADVAIGHRSATVCHLGNIAVRLGRPIRWDPKTETILGDDQAASMLSRPYRSPYGV
ncbi:MAG: Gfo/Idh/MocA family oxidoreductase [Isosphaeraceae bacterium]|nr:Gfo/Idh/MocA family oxidoreductase [Isosphaeraceae bacterium]